MQHGPKGWTTITLDSMDATGGAPCVTGDGALLMVFLRCVSVAVLGARCGRQEPRLRRLGSRASGAPPSVRTLRHGRAGRAGPRGAMVPLTRDGDACRVPGEP